VSEVNLRPILGKTFVEGLDRPVLKIGADFWTKQTLPDIGVVHTKAAAVLTKLAADLRVKSVADLYNRTTPYTFAGHDYHAGVTTLFVALRVFEAHGLSIKKWYHLGEKQAVVTFLRFKHREIEAEKRTKRKR
jgi:hypothetical protein